MPKIHFSQRNQTVSGFGSDVNIVFTQIALNVILEKCLIMYGSRVNPVRKTFLVDRVVLGFAFADVGDLSEVHFLEADSAVGEFFLMHGVFCLLGPIGVEVALSVLADNFMHLNYYYCSLN